MAQSHSYDIIGISKTWWDESCVWCVAIDGYRLFRRDKQGRQGGRVMMYVKHRLDCVEFQVGNDKVESLWVRIKGRTNKGDIIVGVYYRAPGQDNHAVELFFAELRCLEINSPCPYGGFQLVRHQLGSPQG